MNRGKQVDMSFERFENKKFDNTDHEYKINHLIKPAICDWRSGEL
jgi:hypothetical protein